MVGHHAERTTTVINRPTYAQQAFNAHQAGGETQAEATARMSATTLRRMSTGSKVFMLKELAQEAAACHVETDYSFVRSQQLRVQGALAIRGQI